MPRLFAVLLCLTVLGAARAADRLPVREVRFSPDGLYALVWGVGVLDGSGLTRAWLEARRTDTGAPVLSRSRTADAPEATVARALLGAPNVAARLRARYLAPGRVSAPSYRRVYAAPSPRWSDARRAGQGETVTVTLNGRSVPVRLEVYPLPSRCPSRGLLPPGAVPAGVRLRVGAQIVFADKALPAARRCAAGYLLERVDVQGGRLVAVLRAYGPGFEGPDAAPLVVAARLK